MDCHAMRFGRVYAVRDLPFEERPRERMMKNGPSALSEAELLAIILRTGTAEENVIDLSKHILMEHSLKDLCQTGIGELKRYRGINDAKACQIMAAAELANRIYKARNEGSSSISSSRDVFNLVYPDLRFSKKEHFFCIYLNTRNEVIKKELVSVGNLNTSVIHPREIFRSAIRESANTVILVHNHPSGNPEPSSEDVQITKIIIEAGRLMGIQVLDHVVIGEGTHISMAERGIAKF